MNSPFGDRTQFPSVTQPPLDQVLILDTETSGLETKQGQVIEIGAILYSVQTQSIIQEFSTLIPATDNPAEKINRIKPEALQKISWALADYGVKMLKNMAKQAELIVAHNAEFDRKWFDEATRKQTSLVPPLLNANGNLLSWVCTCSDFLWPRQTKSRQSLVDLALAHGIGVASNHRALTDCQLISELFDRMENLPALFEQALRPKARFQALVTYKQKNLAKTAGFQWFPERKTWERTMLVADTQKLSFQVKQLSPSLSPIRQLGHLKIPATISPITKAS